MNWHEGEKFSHIFFKHHHFLSDNYRVFKNNENKRPPWIRRQVENTEFHIKKKKEELLLVIGESWTYG